MMYCVREKGGETGRAARGYPSILAAARNVKELGGSNDLLERILADPRFGLTQKELDTILDPVAFTGMAAQQTEELLESEVNPVLNKYRPLIGAEADVSV